MGQKIMFEGIMAKFFPNLMTNRFKNLRTLCKITIGGGKQNIPRHIIIKLQKKNNGEILQAERKNHVAYSRMKNKSYHSLPVGNLASQETTEQHLSSAKVKTVIWNSTSSKNILQNEAKLRHFHIYFFKVRLHHPQVYTIINAKGSLLG